MYNSILLLILIILNNEINAKITDKQYTAMPEIFYQDNYDVCMLLGNEIFYCSLTYVLEPIDKEYPPEIWNIIKNVSHIATNYRHDHIRHWICVPRTCPEILIPDENNPLFRKEIEDCYIKKFKYLELQGTISEIECETVNPKYPVDWLDIVSGIMFIAYIFFVIFGTFYEGVARLKTQEKYKQLTNTPTGKILSAVSLIKNWTRLTTVNPTPEIRQLRGIQGIRVYNTALVILTHTVLVFLVSPVANTKYPERMHEKYATVFFSSGSLCVATFFFISSFLLSNGLFQYMKDKKGLSVKICLFALTNRLLRLTPILAVVILFHATWLRHLGNGPNWNHLVLMEYTKCRANWWTNLLYIQNWVDYCNMCLPVTWYLGLDTQYFIISLLFIWLMKIYEKYVWFLVGAAITLNIFGTFLQNYYYDFTALILPTPEFFYSLKRMFSSRQFHYQIGGFIGNMAGPIFGIAFGYYYYKHKNDKPEDRLFTTKFRLFLMWILTFGLGFGFVIGTGIIILKDTVEHDAFWASIYVAFSRPVIAFVIGTGIIASTEGVGWIALRVIQWPPTYVLGRLSFSAYLIHMSILLIRMASARYPRYISDFQILMEYFGDLIMVYMAATFLTLFFELPVTELQKFIFTQKEERDEKEVDEVEKNK